MSKFLRYSLTLDYKIEHTGSLNVPNATYKNRIEDGHREEAIIVPIGADVISDLDKERLEYIKEQIDVPYKQRAAAFGRLAVPGSMVFNSALEIVQWEDLSDNQQMKYLEGGYELYYQKTLETVARAISILERKRQLDSGAPDPLLVSQTPAPDTATKDAEQPPAVAVVDAAAEQTDPAARTPAASKQAGKKPRAGSGERKQTRHRVTDKDLEKARDLVIKNPELTQEQICAILGVNENCAGFNNGKPKKLRVVIDNARQTTIGASYKTGREQEETADAFFDANLTSKFKHKRRDNED